MTLVRCPSRLIDETLEHLREGGRAGVERVVFWLAPRGEMGSTTIAEAYVPQQDAAEDYFHIPREGMTMLMSHLRQQRLALWVQVHSHPGEAFHSVADDRWAIVRHEGGLSIVVPEFAAQMRVDNFLGEAAVFCLTVCDRWRRVEGDELNRVLQIVP